MIKRNTLHCGDCFELMKGIADKSVDLILTDIPYGEVNRESNGLRNMDKGKADVVTFSLEELVSEFVRICSGSIYVFCGIEQVSELRRLMVNRGMSTRLCIWEKTNPSPMNGQHIWLSGIECCVFGKFPKATFNERCKNSVWRVSVGRSKIHPTQKPLSLFEYLVQVSSNPGDLVLDPFMGSGTTCLASLLNDRDFIGIEKDPEFFRLAKERIDSEIEL